MKRIVILTAFFSPFWGLGGFSLHAQNDTITLTWQGGTNKAFQLNGRDNFIVNWGDGTVTNELHNTWITHSYADTTRDYNVTITANKDSVLIHIYCPSQQIVCLDVNRCAYVLNVNCIDNHLSLSELYKISEKAEQRVLGTQRLLPQRILVGDSVDYSDQNEFGGIFTNYNLIKNSSPAVFNEDYTIFNGIISLKTAGLYKIIMTNDIIKSNPNYPAQVIAEITVDEPNKDATLSFLGSSQGKLDPIFDSTITNYVVCVDTNVQEIVIKATPTDPNATISGDVGVMWLFLDTNIFTITVTAEDKITTKDYIVTVIKGCEVSIKEITQDLHNIKVYPNPTTGQLTINNEQLTIKSIEIYDIVGRNVGANLRVRPENNEIIVDVSRFSNGIYIIKLNTNRGIIIKKVIKN